MEQTEGERKELKGPKVSKEALYSSSYFTCSVLMLQWTELPVEMHTVLFLCHPGALLNCVCIKLCRLI